MAYELFHGQDFQEAGPILLHAFLSIKDTFPIELPATLSTLFQLTILFHDAGRVETALTLIRLCYQCFTLVKPDLPKDHPLIRICGWLASLDPSQYQAVLTMSLRSVGDNFEKRLGPMDRSTFDLRLQYIYSIGCRRNDSQEAIAFGETLATDCEQILGREDDRTMTVRLALAYVYLAARQWFAAKRIGGDVVAYSKSRSRAQGLAIIAQSEYGLGQTLQAQMKMRQAIDMYAHLKEDIGTRFSLLLLLESWLLKDGMKGSAGQVEYERKSGVHKIQLTHLRDNFPKEVIYNVITASTDKWPARSEAPKFVYPFEIVIE